MNDFNPELKKDVLMSGYTWIENQHILDRIPENTWRIYDKLYDFTDFIKNHPGGQDVTDYYETFHINQEKLEPYLKKYELNNQKPLFERNKRYNFDKKGFYVKLREKAKLIYSDQKNRRATIQMQIICIIIFSIWLSSVALLNIYKNWIWAAISGFLLTSVIGIAHNFIHQPKNIWFYAMDFTSIPHHEWIIIHSISHHTYCNLSNDLEITGSDPFITYLTCQKANHITVLAYQFLVYFMVPISPLIKIIVDLFIKKINPFRWEQILYFGQIPLFVFIQNYDYFVAFKLWYLLHAFAMTFLVFFSVPDHRSNGIWTEGDQNQSEDFGIHIMRTTKDHNRKMNLFLSLLFFQGFNPHIVHHWFPSIDKSQLYRLDGAIKETLKEFKQDHLFKEHSYLKLLALSIPFLIRERPIQQKKQK